MITKLTLRNFKSVGEQVYEFTPFDLLVGRNNSGKSTVLQAMAIWQFCVDEFHRSRRTGTTGIQIVLPNFTALPLPEFILLWKDRTDRAYPLDAESGKKKQEFILIEILLEWQDAAGKTDSFGVELRYHSPQTIYAIPAGGWARFRDAEKSENLPKIAYVPPFSGLEPSEKWLDISPMRQQVGKGQPGSVLRNLLLRVSASWQRDAGSERPTAPVKPSDWDELAQVVERWFGVKISPPRYESTKDVFINVEYQQAGRSYDIISGGSGFHQTLTLLAFLFGYRPTTILLDEPDAHLHVNLQREILDYFKRKSKDLGTQFLIATHAEEFARGVDASQIVSLLNRVPKRVDSTPAVLHAMSEVSNEEVTRLTGSPHILYVEGETDERILRAWAAACGAEAAIDKVCFKAMKGGGKANMKERADQHYAALQNIIPNVTRMMLFDYDDAKKAFHPSAGNPALFEWKRKNIENYLLVPDAWRRAALSRLRLAEDDLFAQPTLAAIDGFFRDENLTLPPGRTWRNVSANIFAVVDGKKLLFENPNSLFQRLKAGDPPLQLLREEVALLMRPDEVHDDVHDFFGKLKMATGTA
ncbi:MAG: AAA family ATPase [Alphaproteobacteria bacterium]|nr:AAA family ATPase [Alphaproteobacteria bacterium]